MRDIELERVKKMSPQVRIDHYLKFIVFFNKFIGHRPKHRRPFKEKDMRL
jgi:hypothetical protein